MIRIFVADDQVVVREGIKRIIADTSDMHVVGEAKASQALIAQVSAQPVDVIILDISMPGGNGLDVLQELRQAQPAVPVLVFSRHPGKDDADRALRAGAKSYFTIDSEPEAIRRTIRKVAQE